MDRLTVFKSFIHHNRRVFLGLFILAAIIFCLVLFHQAAAPVKKLNDWKKLAEKEEFSVDHISGLDSIQKQIAYRKSLLTLTGKDSIHLVINLPDSSIGLFMNGMIILNRRSPVLKKIPYSLI